LVVYFTKLYRIVIRITDKSKQGDNMAKGKNKGGREDKKPKKIKVTP